MNGSEYLIDTNIALYLLSGDQTLSSLLHQKRIYLSIISEIELLRFIPMSDSQEKKIRALIEDCNLIEINYDVRKRAIDIKRKHKLKTPDAIILATAQYLKVLIISADNDLKKLMKSTWCFMNCSFSSL